jgi:hypothetical protein
MQEIKNRDDALAAGQAALQTGLEIGMLNLPIAALGWPAAECVVAGELTLGTSCVRFALAVLAAIGGPQSDLIRRVRPGAKQTDSGNQLAGSSRS